MQTFLSRCEDPLHGEAREEAIEFMYGGAQRRTFLFNHCTLEVEEVLEDSQAQIKEHKAERDRLLAMIAEQQTLMSHIVTTKTDSINSIESDLLRLKEHRDSKKKVSNLGLVLLISDHDKHRIAEYSITLKVSGTTKLRLKMIGHEAFSYTKSGFSSCQFLDNQGLNRDEVSVDLSHRKCGDFALTISALYKDGKHHLRLEDYTVEGIWTCNAKQHESVLYFSISCYGTPDPTCYVLNRNCRSNLYNWSGTKAKGSTFFCLASDKISINHVNRKFDYG